PRITYGILHHFEAARVARNALERQECLCRSFASMQIGRIDRNVEKLICLGRPLRFAGPAVRLSHYLIGSGRVSRSEPTQHRLGFGLYGGGDLVRRLHARVASELASGRGGGKALDDALNGPADGDTNRQYRGD